MVGRLSEKEIEFVKSRYQTMSDKELAQTREVDKKFSRRELNRLSLRRTKKEEKTIRKERIVRK